MAQTSEIERVSVEDARTEARTGRAMLVCAYDDARCSRIRFEGAITLRELERQAASLPKSQELVFYCA